MKKIILTAAIAAALTLSCAPAEDEGEETNGNGGNGGNNNSGGNSSGGTTETYTLTSAEEGDEYFSYLIPYEWDICEEGGVLKTEKDSFEREQYYSISNKIMTWGDEWDIENGDTLLFKGSSNELKDTWTRKKGNKATSCRYDEDNYYDPGMQCKYGYDITKAVFTDSKVAITREECLTDYEVDGEDYGNGWKNKVVNCNTTEISKGSDKITIKRTKTSEEISYKGKSCKWSEPTKAQKQSACKKAWTEYQDEDEYYSILRELNYAYNECIDNMGLPEEFTGGDDYDFCDVYPEYCEEEGSLQGKIAAKQAAKAKVEAKTKAKFKLLLKKKK